jgi:hypothetical protein
MGEHSTPAERIADVLHSIGFGAERYGIAEHLLTVAQTWPDTSGPAEDNRDE